MSAKAMRRRCPMAAAALVALGPGSVALADHGAQGSWSGGSQAIDPLLFAGLSPARWRLQIGYGASLTRPSEVSPGTVTLKPFGSLWTQSLRVGLGYAWSERWQVQAAAPLVWLVRDKASPRHLVGLGDLEALVQLRVSDPQIQWLQLLVRAGLEAPLARYRRRHTLSASYLQPNPQNGALTVRNLQAFSGTSQGVLAARLGVAMSWKPHPWTRLVTQGALRLPVTTQKPRWGLSTQTRLGLDLGRPGGQLRQRLGLEWSFFGRDRWGQDPQNPVSSASAHRLDLRLGFSYAPNAKHSCALSAGMAVWQRSLPGSMVQAAFAGLSCQRRWGPRS